MKKVLTFIPFAVGIVFILLFWQNTILNIFTKMHDWYDGAFIVWTMQNNIKHFYALDFRHLFETNAMYPFTNSLSFTDHLFIPSLFAFVISFFSPNPLFQFNLVSIMNHLLVFMSFYVLAGRFSKQNWVKLLVALYGSFGPYFFSQFGHLQMVFMWPLIFSLYYLLETNHGRKSLILCGLFLGIQFLTGVYLGLIGLSVITLYFAAEIIFLPLNKNKKYSVQIEVVKTIKQLCIILGLFLAVSAVSIYGYLKVNIQYHPVRDQSEFVTYSAHVTDYVLVMFTNSWFNRVVFSPLIAPFNHHSRGELAGFVGVIPLVVSGWWVIAERFNRRKTTFKTIVFIWLLLLIVIGIIFSLGPRMNWNGNYLVTPLPYWLVMKLFPPVAIMRAVSRWYFMVVLATTFFFAQGLDSLKNKIVILSIFVLFLIEFYPLPLQVTSNNWRSPSYLYLQKVCVNNPGAVLEYPFEYRDRANNIGKYLSIKTNTLMSSTLHNCPTLSGFSSFEPPLFKKWQEDFDTNGITDSNLQILKDNKFAFVRVNLEALSTLEKAHPYSVIHTTHLRKVFSDSYSIIFKIIY